MKFVLTLKSDIKTILLKMDLSQHHQAIRGISNLARCDAICRTLLPSNFVRSRHYPFIHLGEMMHFESVFPETTTTQVA